MDRLILKGATRCGTTIMRDMLSEHNDIYLTNEIRIYSLAYKFNDPRDYFEALLGNIVNEDRKNFRNLDRSKEDSNNYHKIPEYVDIGSFVGSCLNELKSNSVRGKLEAAEAVLYGSRFKYYGDKGTTHVILKNMSNMNIPFKLIFMYRDGRDVAASGVRHGQHGTAPWHGAPPWSTDPVKNVNVWTNTIKPTLDVIDRGYIKDYIFIKFEDFMDYPEKNMTKIGNFLNLDIQKLLDIQNNKFDTSKSNKGYFKEWCSDWHKTFPSSAKSLLKRLGYI